MPATEHIDLRNYEALTSSTVLVANYRSFSEALTLSTTLPGKKCFVLDKGDSIIGQSHKFSKEDDFVQVDFDADQQEIEAAVTEKFQEGTHIMMFPERHATGRPGIQEVHPLAVRLARTFTKGVMLGIGVETGGADHPDLRVVAAPAVTAPPPGEDQVDDAIFLRNVLEMAEFHIFDHGRSLLQVLFDAANRHGLDKVIVSQTKPPAKLTYRQLIQSAYALGLELGKKHQPGERVGLMVPSSRAFMQAFYACQFAGLVPAIINFTSGPENVVACCAATEVSTVYTVRPLLENSMPASAANDAMFAANIKVAFLEDIRQFMSIKTKALAWLKSRNMDKISGDMPGSDLTLDNEAVVLFTSGSQGPPKGVALSQRNICSNIYQILARLDVQNDEQLLNTLPSFHSFGLMGGTLLPIARGVHVWQYPTPLDYRGIVELIADKKISCLFSTGTFLGRYAKEIQEDEVEQMKSLRLLIAGGEKLRGNVRKIWDEKLELEIYEGYGVTEASPGVCISTPFANRKGSVGLVLPDIEVRLQPQEGIDAGGTLVIKGSNVMLGYLLPDQPGVLQAPPDGWYDTGDVVNIDKDGYVYIVGRHKRFAKVAGEMVPMGRIENELGKLKEDGLIAVIALPDEAKGERLLVVSEDLSINQEHIAAALQEAGFPPLWIPQDVVYLTEEDFPLLGSGKYDYQALERRYNV